ncbi:unnamed protein product [Pleuronectes platessa]|uniref:Uncharacterized protein n=1 Tax=Pleuronectes platessa TaxID=8262 RepID=A0A9N7UXJ6_PLEPL|nr:unnamed protein product [Pleuronectes platessa]
MSSDEQEHFSGCSSSDRPLVVSVRIPVRPHTPEHAYHMTTLTPEQVYHMTNHTPEHAYHMTTHTPEDAYHMTTHTPEHAYHMTTQTPEHAYHTGHGLSCITEGDETPGSEGDQICTQAAAPVVWQWKLSNKGVAGKREREGERDGGRERGREG